MTSHERPWASFKTSLFTFIGCLLFCTLQSQRLRFGASHTDYPVLSWDYLSYDILAYTGSAISRKLANQLRLLYLRPCSRTFLQQKPTSKKDETKGQYTIVDPEPLTLNSSFHFLFHYPYITPNIYPIIPIYSLYNPL